MTRQLKRRLSTDDLIIDNTERKLLFYKLEIGGDQY